jgi:hypothetical protein
VRQQRRVLRKFRTHATHTLLESVVMQVCTRGSTSSGLKSHLVAMLSRCAVATCYMTTAAAAASKSSREH